MGASFAWAGRHASCHSHKWTIYKSRDPDDREALREGLMSSEIERFQTPGNIEDAILLVVSAGVSDFIQNTVASIERSGASDYMICIALPQDALAEVRTAVSRWVNVKYVFLEDICRADYSLIHEYHEYGTCLL